MQLNSGPSVIRPTLQETQNGHIRQVTYGERESSVKIKKKFFNACFMANWSLSYKYTCTLSTFKVSNIATIPTMWCIVGLPT